MTHPTAPKKAHPATPGKKWSPPRGIRLFTRKDRPNAPFRVQWKVDGERSIKAFGSAGAQIEFAKSLAGDVETIGIEAFRLNTDEARAWRAFVAQIKPASLEDVLAVWNRHGRPEAITKTVPDAVEEFLLTKTREGLSAASVGHYRPVLERFAASLGSVRVSAVTREQVAAYVEGIKGADYTRLTTLKRIRTLFHWLKSNRFVADSPCDGIKGVRIAAGEVEILTLEEARSLFAKNESDRELCGRLALEAFCGIRFTTASQIMAADIDFKARGIRIPADKIKTRRAEYIDKLPDNLWRWLEWSDPSTWKYQRANYLFKKSQAFVRAGSAHPHNALRHSFCTYHVAAYGDAGKTATILCHSTPKTTYRHYKGRAAEADGLAYFAITPSA